MTGKRKSSCDLSCKTVDDAPSTSNKRIELEELFLAPPTQEAEVSDLENDIDEDDGEEESSSSRL
jgi:hypothetical protein